jgi:hypothetical protein
VGDRRLLGPPARLRVAWLCFALHVLALAGTLLVLLRGLPPGDLAARREFVATHAAAWGMAWVGWMLVSLSVLVLFAAWAETLPHRGWGRWAVAVTLAGVVLDFHHSRIAVRREDRRVLVDLEPGDRQPAVIQATFDLGRAARELPPESRFPTLAAAQGFLVELFAAFAYDPVTERVSTVRIERGSWDVQVVPDERRRYDLMQGSALFPGGAARLDSVFYVRDLPYRWHALER